MLRAAEHTSEERRLVVLRNADMRTRGVIGVKAAVDKGGLVDFKRPANIGTDGLANTLYPTGAEGPIGTGKWTPTDGGYHPSQEGHTGTGAQEKRVLGAGVAAAVIMMWHFDAMLMIAGILMTFPHSEPRPRARLAAREAFKWSHSKQRRRRERMATMTAAANGCQCGDEGRRGYISLRKLPSWTTSGLKPWATTPAEEMTELEACMSGTSVNAPLMGTIGKTEWQAEFIDATVPASCSLRKANWRTRTAAIEFEGNFMCLGRRVISQHGVRVLAPHSARGELEGLLLGLGRQHQRRRAVNSGG